MALGAMAWMVRHSGALAASFPKRDLAIRSGRRSGIPRNSLLEPRRGPWRPLVFSFPRLALCPRYHNAQTFGAIGKRRTDLRTCNRGEVGASYGRRLRPLGASEINRAARR